MGHPQRYEIHITVDPGPEPVHILGNPKTHPEVTRVLDWVSEAARGRVANMHPTVRNPHAISFTAWRDGAESVAALVQKYPGVTVKDAEGKIVEAPATTRETFATVAASSAPNTAVSTQGYVNSKGDDLWGDEYVETGGGD